VISLLVGDTIMLEATDATSGVRRIEYLRDGSAWTTYSGSLAFDTPGQHVLAFRAMDNAGNLEATHILMLDVTGNVTLDVTHPFNWTPTVAAILAATVAVVGGILVSRRKDSRARPSKKLVWSALAAPWTALELVIGASSWVTGDLAMPPWLGAGLITVIAAAVAGLASIALGAKGLTMEAPTTGAGAQVDGPRD